MTHPPGNQPTSSTQLGPGDKCDRYEIVRLIGVGGMGEVYEALHEFTKKPVALKVLKLGASAKPALIDKMRAEAMVMCRIKHDNLVEVYDAGILDSHLIWMAMELLSGESLRERLLRGAVPVAQALDWAVQIADGVAAAQFGRPGRREPAGVALLRRTGAHQPDRLAGRNALGEVLDRGSHESLSTSPSFNNAVI